MLSIKAEWRVLGLCGVFLHMCASTLVVCVVGHFQQNNFTYNLCIPIEGSEVQRSPSIFVRVVNDRTFLHQKLHYVLMSF